MELGNVCVILFLVLLFLVPLHAVSLFSEFFGKLVKAAFTLCNLAVFFIACCFGIRDWIREEFTAGAVSFFGILLVMSFPTMLLNFLKWKDGDPSKLVD
jgi:hypothetical protein